MSKKTTLAGTVPFAHLLSGAAALAGRAIGKKAEEDTPVDDEGPTDEDEVVDDEVEDVEEPENTGKKGKSSKGKKAEEEEDDVDADAGDDDDVDAEEPDDEKQAKAFRAGRAAERKRCAAIFASPAAAGRPDLAATLAFQTSQTSAEAIAVLTTANNPGAQPRGQRLDDRMGSRREHRPGGGTGAAGATTATFADQMAAALKKAGR